MMRPSIASYRIKNYVVAWLATGMLSLSACTTTASTELTSFASATSNLRLSMDANLADANRLARNVAIEDFIRSGDIGLSERRFPPVVPAEVVQAWRQSLGLLHRYATLLASLSEPSRGRRTAGAMQSLGIELRDGRSGIDLDPGVAAGFAGLAGALIDLRAQENSQAVLRRTDPAVRTLLQNMAQALGDNDRSGLRGTVAVGWQAQLSDTQAVYAQAASERNEPRMRALIDEYLAGIDRRDHQLQSLAELRTSLIALADAHTAAASGSRRPFDAVAADLEDRLEQIARAYESIFAAGTNN